MSQSGVHQFWLVVASSGSFGVGLTASIVAIEWLLEDLVGHTWWLEWLLMPLFGGGVVLALIVFGVWLFSLPLVHLVAAIMWALAIVYLLFTLPFHLASLKAEPFQQWDWWLKWTLPTACLTLQVLLVGVLALFLHDLDSVMSDGGPASWE